MVPLGLVSARRCGARSFRFWSGSQTTLVIGTAASSTVRSGMNRGMVCHVPVGCGLKRCGRFCSGTACLLPLSWSARLRFRGRGGGWIELSCDLARYGGSCRGELVLFWVCLVESWKPPTRSAWLRLRCRKVGWIAARHVGASCVTSGSVLSWLVLETTIVLARRPINAAVVGCTQASWCELRRCAERRVVFWH